MPSGVDNRVFRLGDEMLIRLPSASGYAAQVKKEQKWLPILAANLSIQIPSPVAMGGPSDAYPCNWSVYRWIEGKSANSLELKDQKLCQIAHDLASFLLELHSIETGGAPEAGLHNYYRGGSLSVYDSDTKKLINDLQTIIDKERALAVWQKALSKSWSRQPVWVHGDIASGNLLIDKGRLNAVIDFGCMGVGDPACDLVIAWTFFKDESRQIFMQKMNLDPDTWARARGWALWKACFELAGLEDKSKVDALGQKQLIQEILEFQF